MIQPGEMRWKIIVRKLTTSRDEYGSEKEVWSNFLTLRAQVKFSNGNKGIDNSEVFNSATMRFITHYRPITDTMIINFNNKNYRILSIAEIGFRDGLDINTELINE